MKHTTALVTFVGAAALLAGCAGTGTTPDVASTADDKSQASSQSSSGNSAAKSDSSTTTIEFWSNHPGNSLELEKKIISDFEKENPDITVKLVDGGKNYEEVAQKFNAALAGGQVPDVVVASRCDLVQLRAQRPAGPDR
ncbi:extracellular solute-binding protein [Corynebacterium mendelii]|uniref:extracellular solute-binding protein n=1 Tax=Corynebacterium mendelii TaxID=2765362 RepID=UPI002101DF10|nr:extracellular solute-binding protein [Corynebacterium mendelii]